MKLIINVVLIFFGFALVSAQKTFSVEGIVQDFHDKSVLENAEIVIGNQKVKSDKNGKFIFRKIPQGNYTLTAHHDECDDYSQAISVNQDLFLTISLEHHVHEIEAVNLHNNHKKKASIIVQTLDKAVLERNSTENLGNLVSKISGVTVLKTGNNIAKPVIHGMYGSRISILNDGVKLAEQEWGVEHAPNVDVNGFEHVDVIKGASTLKYGNEAVGGIVLLEPEILPKKDTLMGNLKLSGISNGRGAEFAGNIAKTWKNQWFVRTGGSFKKLGDLYQPHHTLQNTGAEVRSFNFSFGKRSFLQGFDVSYSGIDQQFGIFKGAHLESPEDFYNAINFGQPFYLDNFSYDIDNPKQEVAHHIAKLSAYKRFADFGKFSFQYSFQLNRRKEFDIRRGESDDLPSMDLRLITHSVSLIHQIERNKWSLESGISAAFQDNFPNPDTKARRLIPDYYRYDAGVFSVFKYKLNHQIDAEAGIRYDFNRYDAYKYYDKTAWEKYENVFPEFVVSEHDSRILARPILDYHNISANLGFNYKPSKNFEAKLNFSRTDRAPNAAELFADGLHHSAAVMESGDLRLKKETVYQANLSLQGNVNLLKGLLIQVNPYIMVSDSYINQIPTGVKSTNRGVFPEWSVQQIKARLYGVDADLSLSILDHLKWTTSFSALRGQDLSHDEPLILMMPANLRNGIELNLNKPKNFYVRLENENAFHQNRYPIRNLDVSFIENGSLVTKEVDFSTPPKAYSLFHLGFGLDVAENLSFHFKLNNIFNTEYREYLNRLRYYMPEAGRNFIVTLQYKF